MRHKKVSIITLSLLFLCIFLIAVFNISKANNQAADNPDREEVETKAVCLLGAKVKSFPVYVYNDGNSGENKFFPTGMMGDINDSWINSYCKESPYAGSSCIKIVYKKKAGQIYHWTGLYWQAPANNWSPGSQPGYDLTGATTLTFWARGENGGETGDFMIGGDQGNSFRKIMSSETLSEEWIKYSVDLSNADLSNVGWGFGVKILPVRESSTANSGTVSVYLDDIEYHFD